MSKKQFYLGALSQDLFRIANFIQTGSVKNAERFWQEVELCVNELKKEKNSETINKIIARIEKIEFDPSSIKQAEDILTYVVIVQSMAVHAT